MLKKIHTLRNNIYSVYSSPFKWYTIWMVYQINWWMCYWFQCLTKLNNFSMPIWMDKYSPMYSLCSVVHVAWNPKYWYCKVEVWSWHFANVISKFMFLFIRKKEAIKDSLIQRKVHQFIKCDDHDDSSRVECLHWTNCLVIYRLRHVITFCIPDVIRSTCVV